MSNFRSSHRETQNKTKTLRPALSAVRKGWVGLSDASPIPAQAPPLPPSHRPGSGDSMQKKI
ncbi:hypothetical protein APE01nite_20170 [Acetobacter peroxydans]|uniref:Uncharacterized protein n=1 Tax=Acetobacter peroxydans TaxID=104098 RepID=A0A4Y3TYY5_9PROT|nr:hypothetical protein AA13755_1286 [Acetobacter peroxydans NBRC 13755]GBR39436.1 hypothetical protein AA0475_0188 [Acetobacter peroxydans]GEB86220.1 hypothetical protein APE01nite_20170 [Acetobacter peroxydans]